MATATLNDVHGRIAAWLVLAVSGMAALECPNTNN
jgi:hypothetical protein